MKAAMCHADSIAIRSARDAVGPVASFAVPKQRRAEQGRRGFMVILQVHRPPRGGSTFEYLNRAWMAMRMAIAPTTVR